MATSFPSSLDSFTNPVSSDTLSSPSHAGQHTDLNDAVAALQSKVGADSSAVTASLDYKVAQLEARTSGKILQVVSTTKSDVWSESVANLGTSSLVTGLTATITPSSTSSNVLVFVTLHMHLNQWAWPFVFLMRDTTHIGGGTASGSMPSITFGDFSGAGAGASYGGVGNLTGHYLDSPSSTSALTYGIKFYNPYGLTATLALNECYYYTSANNGRFSSMITVMEVAA